MSKYIQFVLVILYALITIGALFIVFDLFGWRLVSHNNSLMILALLGWLVFCFATAWFIPDLSLLFRQVRKPLYEEEVYLKQCLSRLQEKTGVSKKYRLRIQEEMGISAAALGHNMILVSKGSLQELTPEELTAVMAHELGHLTSKDGIALMAYVCATYVPRKISTVLRRLLKFIVRIGIAGGLVGLVVIGILLAWFHVFHYLLPSIAFILFVSGLDRLFSYLWLMNARYTEYRQDAFAHRLGFGTGLRVFLFKIIDNTPQEVRFFYTLTSSHPVIYNRIRRLEKLEGLNPE